MLGRLDGARAGPVLHLLALAVLALVRLPAAGASLIHAGSQPRERPAAELGEQPSRSQGREGLVADLGDKPIRVELENYLDLQYLARISVGTPPQELRSIIDTGSFDLVVFEKGCQGCGLAGAYNHHRSSTNRRGRLTTQLSFGSGEVVGDQAFDKMSLGNSKTIEQGFWQIHQAEMPLLDHAKFQSILGVGPPETPAADAWDEAGKALKTVANFMREDGGDHVPNRMLKEVEANLATAMDLSNSRGTVLKTFGVRSFSVCLGRKPGSKGYFVWNDTLAKELPQAFSRLQVVGKHSWTVRLTSARLSSSMPGPDSVSPPIGGCENGCSAVIDSGTSLLVAPETAVDFLEEAIQMVNHDCNGLQDLPSLVLTIDGHEFIMPPDAYATKAEAYSTCRLQNSATVSTATSDQGPLWILGMPFLRRYYTTFHLGEDLKSRSLLVAASNGDCSPGVKRGFSLSAQRDKPYLRTYNPEAAYLTPLARKATTQSFVHI